MSSTAPFSSRNWDSFGMSLEFPPKTTVLPLNLLDLEVIKEIWGYEVGFERWVLEEEYWLDLSLRLGGQQRERGKKRVPIFMGLWSLNSKKVWIFQELVYIISWKWKVDAERRVLSSSRELIAWQKKGSKKRQFS
jgi:hypothetical protein